MLKLKENRADKYATKCQIKWLQSAKTPRMCWAYILPLVPNLSRFGKFKYIVFTMHLDIHYFRYIVKSMHLDLPKRPIQYFLQSYGLVGQWAMHLHFCASPFCN